MGIRVKDLLKSYVILFGVLFRFQHLAFLSGPLHMFQLFWSILQSLEMGSLIPPSLWIAGSWTQGVAGGASLSWRSASVYSVGYQHIEGGSPNLIL